ncbi:MAG TPA: response regulator [Gemmatimonadales bacterium]|nr:response regulator [Gemmatimonadales bacterium]
MPGEAHLSQGIRILVVEDDADIRQSIASILTEEGYEVRVARDGQEALDELFREGADLPALIIFDLLMPRLDGWQLAELLKSYAKTSRIPLIIVSAYAERAPEGITILGKPMNRDDLLNLVREKSGPRAVASLS